MYVAFSYLCGGWSSVDALEEFSSAEYFGLQVFDSAAHESHFFDEFFDGDVAIFWGCEVGAHPGWEHVVVDAAEVKLLVPQAYGYARAEDCLDDVGFSACEEG